MKNFKILIILLLLFGIEYSAFSDGNKPKKATSTNLIVPGKLVVKLKSGYTLKESGLDKTSNTQSKVSFEVKGIKSAFQNFKKPENGRQVSKSGIDFSQYYLLDVDNELSITKLVEELERAVEIEYAEPVFMRKISYDPNDANIASQTYLSTIKANEAWDIEQGDGTVVVAIVDSGVDYLHEDLTDNLYVNTGEIPDNGIDDDADGYIDNYYGWDFVGSDFNNIVGDNDPLANLANIGHGTNVAGCAAASTDNEIGVASIGFNTKFMALKCSAENDTRSNGSGFVINATDAVIYAAEHGADVINMSYGSSAYSQFDQDVMTYAAIEKGVVLVAAAGNDGVVDLYYPAAYDHVLSVAATNDNDIKAGFSNYGYWVDISAPGVSTYTTFINNNYDVNSGTSFSSPITAGAAALLVAKYPDYNPFQIRELLIQSAEPIDKSNGEFAGQLGKGRLDVANALSITTPAFRITNHSFGNDTDQIPAIGETAFMSIDLTNELETASSEAVLNVTQTSGTTVTLDEITFSLASFASGHIEVYDPLFSFVVPEEISFFETLEFNFEFSDATSDYVSNRRISVVINPIVTSTKSLPYLLADGGDFESNLDDFKSGPISGGINLWEIGTPTNTLIEVNSGVNAWKTDLDENLVKEDYSCVLQTPTFDFSLKSKEYKISFYKSMESEFCNAPSAVQMQYSFDGLTWTRLGTGDDLEGTNWYNKTPSSSCAIDVQIFQDQHGWLGNFSNEYTAYDVSFLEGNSSVVFRYVLSVSSAFESDINDDGFMIDDFEVTISNPSAEFVVDVDVAAIGRDLRFTYLGNGAETFSWDFGDGGTSDLRNPSHAYETAGDFTVALTITSPDGTATETKTDYIEIFELKKYSPPYLEADGGNFEVNQDDFVATNITGTAFELGESTVSGKDGTASGDFAWVTGITEDNYQDDSEAYLYTPTFDFSEDKDFKFNFKAKYNFEDEWDGFIVEYSTDFGETWIKLNNVQEAGWYSQVSVEGAVFGDLTPIFSGDTGGEFESYSTNVSFLSPEENVLFRFKFLSDANTTEAGAAIDDFSVTAEDFVNAVADFTYANNTGCSGQEVTFTSSSTGSINGFSWDFGVGATPSTANGIGPHVVTYTSGTLILSTVSLTVEGLLNGFVTETKTDEISTTVLHVPSISEIDNGNETSFELESTAGDSYQWYLNTDAINGATSRVYETSQEGSYEVGVDIDGCVVRSADYEAAIVTSLTEQLSAAINVYPNPSSGIITIELNAAVENNSSLKIYDLIGREVVKKELTEGVQQINLISLNKGTYFVEIRNGVARGMRRVIIN